MPITTSQVVTTQLSLALFAALAGAAFASWTTRRDQRSARLAIATGLYAASQVISSISGYLYDGITKMAPRALGVTSSTLPYLAFLAFLLFLFAFLDTRAWATWTASIVTVALIGLSIVETTKTAIVGKRYVFHASPLPFKPYLYIVIGWLVIVTGVLWVAFVVYGFRQAGIARLRMLSIGSGFFLLFVVIGLLPLILINNSTESVRHLLDVIRYVALASAPLLFFGFAPLRATGGALAQQSG